MTVVAIVAQKGGVGKTTLATNLAWSFAQTGSVLLLEVWPESHWQGFALRQADVLQSYTA